MKRVGLLVLVLFFALFACNVQAKDSGVRFSDLSGEVQVRPDEDRLAWDFAELDMVLNVMDHIRTKRDSSAILSLADMTTFVMKPESEIILNTESERENKIQLLAGKVWVNVKKMVKDGSLDVEMGQAVAGIKGTNITCSSNEDGSENRIKVLRGMARVMIRESKEQVDVGAGEELIVKKGAKPEKVELDVEEEQKYWEEQVTKMGRAIQMDDIPDIIKKIGESQNQEIARIKNTFENLLKGEKVEAEAVAELQKDAERFIGVILEDSIIIAGLRARIDEALAAEDIAADQRPMLANLQRELNALSNLISANQAEASKIMRYQFKLSAVFEDISSEVEMALSQINSVGSDVEAIRSEISGNPSGKSQDWFADSRDELLEKLNELGDIIQKTQELIERNPQDVSAQNLLKQASALQTTIATLLKNLSVVEISSSTITELQQIDYAVSDQMVVLQNEITAYNSINSASADVAERRLQASLKILDNYARVRRNYLSAQRLYDSVMRSVKTSKYKTSEQEEIETLWQNISDRFQQLGIVADELQSNIQSLESQLRQWLR